MVNVNGKIFHPRQFLKQLHYRKGRKNGFIYTKNIFGRYYSKTCYKNVINQSIFTFKFLGQKFMHNVNLHKVRMYHHHHSI